MTGWSEKLNHMKLGQFPGLYSTLSVPDMDSMIGDYQGSFIGPKWLRLSAGPGLVVSGLKGWWGKRFHGDKTAVNLVQANGQLMTKFPMRLVAIKSLIDGKPGVALHYNSENPFPWPQIVDEIRQLNPGVFLGMTYIQMRPFCGLILPFLLEHQGNILGF